VQATHEVVIVGGGIAGASLAYFLTRRGARDVVLIEREGQPGTHATGRSAAVVYEIDPLVVVQRLKTLGAQFLRDPPVGFCERPLLDRLGILTLFGDSSWSLMRHAAAALASVGVHVETWNADECVARVPALDRRPIAGALYLPEDGHLDVHALLTSYLRAACADGAHLRCGLEVTGVLVEGGRCVGVATTAGPLRARWVVDAAGAWAQTIAGWAGAAPIDIVPKRRCAVVFEPPPGIDVAGWPMVCCDDHRVYFEPESGGLLMSPMDEAPMAPCDARPDDETIAAGFERLRQLAPALVPRSIRRKWAGLRSFAPDGAPVVGEDPRRPGFFWLAGQGGFGIETSPALGAIAADLLTTGTTVLFDAAALSPHRFQI
jgi:D-arginine dehydrogenase